MHVVSGCYILPGYHTADLYIRVKNEMKGTLSRFISFQSRQKSRVLPHRDRALVVLVVVPHEEEYQPC